MGLSWGAMGKTGQGDGRLRRRKSWDSIMTPSFDSVPGLIPLDKVAKEAGELLVAMYGGSTSRALSSFDVSAIEEHSAAPPVPSATARTARTAAPPCFRAGSRAGLEAVPEGSVLVVPALPNRGDGRGLRWRWRIAASRK